MDRRQFVQRTAVTGLGLLTSGDLALIAQERGDSGGVRDHALALIQAERRVGQVLASQIVDRAHREAGGFIAPAFGFSYPALVALELRNLGALYCHESSRFHQQAELAGRISLAIGNLEREQHEDGTIDLPTTNFHSPPDTAFVVQDLVLLHRLLLSEQSAPAREWRERLERFLRRAAGAIAGGGIHTPNHRWVACAALAGCHRLFGDPLWLRRIDAWLAEGIDCNADGEYTELSNAIYNPVSNRSLMTVAESLDRPALLEPVRRNLEMMLYCIHPDGEVVTDYSRRQDRLTRARASGYYLHYRVMSVRDGNGRMATMADQILADAARRPNDGSMANELSEFMLRPELREERVVRAPLPVSYVRHFVGSNVVRIRRDRLSATIVPRSSRFFSMRSGTAILEAVRVASAFFGKGQFISGSLDADGRSFRLHQDLEAAYYQPLPAGAGIPETDWDKLDRAKRERSHICRLSTKITLSEVERGFEMVVSAAGTDRVPIVVEFWFRPGGRIAAASGGEIAAANGSTFLLSGSAEYIDGKSKIVIGPIDNGQGRADHRWSQVRGAEPPLSDALPLTIAGFTPFEMKIRMTAETE